MEITEKEFRYRERQCNQLFAPLIIAIDQNDFQSALNYVQGFLSSETTEIQRKFLKDLTFGVGTSQIGKLQDSDRIIWTRISLSLCQQSKDSDLYFQCIINLALLGEQSAIKYLQNYGN